METNTYKNLINKTPTNNPVEIIVHHTGGTDKYPLMDTSHHTAQDIEKWHLSLGWEGIGYHYIIHKDGEVWKGRPEHRHGAHCLGKNTSSLGICLSGNFDLTLPTKEQENSLRTLLKALMNRYAIKSVVPHREYQNKTCFGKNLKADWAFNLTIENDILKQERKEMIKKLVDLL